jgi:hypothetical protein
MENKEQIKQAARDNWDSINGQFKDGLNPHAHMIGFVEGASWQSSQPINSGWVKDVAIKFSEYIRLNATEVDNGWKKNGLTHTDSELFEQFIKEKYSPPNSGWVSVEDRLPDNGRTVLVADIESGIVDTGFNAFDQKNRFVANTVMTVTHWAELPSPPKQ